MFFVFLFRRIVFLDNCYHVPILDKDTAMEDQEDEREETERNAERKRIVMDEDFHAEQDWFPEEIQQFKV